MTLNEIGRVVEDEWLKAVQARPFIKLDEYIVMPNHFHAILYIERPLERAKRHPHRLFLDAGAQALAGRCRGPFAESVGSTVAAFKSAVTKKVNTVRGMKGFPVWQRGYFERVVRDEDELNDIRTYIIQNPVRWDRDAENPLRASLRLTGKVFTLE
jgi:REP element-mobilizing transposase RayT